jgi:hypothetical protein
MHSQEDQEDQDADLRELVRTLDALHDAQIDEHVRDLVWHLIMDVEDYRRRNKGAIDTD